MGEKCHEACQSPHFGKISEMKSISEPLSPIEIHTHWQNLSLDEEEINIFFGSPSDQVTTTRIE